MTMASPRGWRVVYRDPMRVEQAREALEDAGPDRLVLCGMLGAVWKVEQSKEDERGALFVVLGPVPLHDVDPRRKPPELPLPDEAA